MSMAKLVGEGPILLAQPQLIQLLGRSGAQFLNQIHFWLSKEQGVVDENGTRWVYNSENVWAKQLCLSQRQIRRYVSKFIDQGLISVKKLSRHKSNRTNYFSINYEAISQLLAQPQPDISSSSTGHLAPLVIQETTNKDLNKSETKSKTVNSEENPLHVEQVKKLNDKKNKVEEAVTRSSSNTTAQDMLKIWNTTFENSPVKLSKDLAKCLVGAFKHKFSNTLEAWQEYCNLITSSSYLTSEKFSLTLSWALKFSTIDRLRTGDLGVKTETIAPSETNLQEKALIHIQSVTEPSVCKETRRLLLKTYGAGAYLSWFTCVDIVCAEGQGGVHLKPHNMFVQNELERRFGNILKRE